MKNLENDTYIRENELSETELEQIDAAGKVGALLCGIVGNGIYYGAGYTGARLAGWNKKKAKSYAKSCSQFGTVIGSAFGAVLPF